MGIMRLGSAKKCTSLLPTRVLVTDNRFDDSSDSDEEESYEEYLSKFKSNRTPPKSPPLPRVIQSKHDLEVIPEEKEEVLSGFHSSRITEHSSKLASDTRKSLFSRKQRNLNDKGQSVDSCHGSGKSIFAQNSCNNSSLNYNEERKLQNACADDGVSKFQICYTPMTESPPHKASIPRSVPSTYGLRAIPADGKSTQNEFHSLRKPQRPLVNSGTRKSLFSWKEPKQENEEKPLGSSEVNIMELIGKGVYGLNLSYNDSYLESSSISAQDDPPPSVPSQPVVTLEESSDDSGILHNSSEPFWKPTIPLQWKHAPKSVPTKQGIYKLQHSLRKPLQESSAQYNCQRTLFPERTPQERQSDRPPPRDRQPFYGKNTPSQHRNRSGLHSSGVDYLKPGGTKLSETRDNDSKENYPPAWSCRPESNTPLHDHYPTAHRFSKSYPPASSCRPESNIPLHYHDPTPLISSQSYPPASSCRPESNTPLHYHDPTPLMSSQNYPPASSCRPESNTPLHYHDPAPLMSSQSRSPKGKKKGYQNPALCSNITDSTNKARSGACEGSNKIVTTPAVEMCSQDMVDVKNKNISEVDSSKRILTIRGVSYNVKRMLAKGGSSQVYEVCHPSTGVDYAAKIVDLNVDEQTQAGLKKEIELLEKLKHSSRIVRLIAYEFVGKKLYLLMEKGECDLASYIKNQNINSEKIRYLWLEMLEAVNVIHKEGIIHCDIKPANFLMCGSKLKLIDFGISLQIENEMTSVMNDYITGTLNYLSPEAIENYKGTINQHKLNLKSDIWALGCILYNMVYKKYPFDHIKTPVLKLKAITDVNQSIDFAHVDDDSLLDVLKKCLNRDPLQRPTVDELLNHPYLTNIITEQMVCDRIKKAQLTPTKLKKLYEFVNQLAGCGS